MRTFPQRFAALVVLLPVALAGLTGCASDSGSGSSNEAAGTSAGSTGPAAGGPAGDTGNGDCQVKVGGDLKTKPTVTIPACAAKPAQLQSTDVIAGTGETAAAGDSVSVQYAGFSWSTKRQFDASWDRGGEPFTVSPLGQARVIDGWNQGLVGAKVGGRRLLVIPPDLGYGPQGAGSAIGPNETLVFVVDVVTVER